MEQPQSLAFRLPEDIWCLIFEELETYADRHRVDTPIWQFATDYTPSPRSQGLRNLSSTCRALRASAEPFLFRFIVLDERTTQDNAFGSRCTRWMSEMLQKDSLRYQVQIFELHSWDHFGGDKQELWGLLTLLIHHFASLRKIVLDMWDTFSPVLLNPFVKTPNNAPPKNSSKRGLSSLRAIRSLFPTRNHKQIPSDDSPFTSFPSIVEVATTIQLIAVLQHFPNMQAFVTTHLPFSTSVERVLRVMGPYLPRMKRICLPCFISADILRELAVVTPDVEELALYPPVREELLLAGAASMHLNEAILFEASHRLEAFSKLKALTLRHVRRSELFPVDTSGMLSTDVHNIVKEMATACPSLMVIRFGIFCHRKEEEWKGHKVTLEPDSDYW